MKEMDVTVKQGDCLDLMQSMSENSVDSVVTDPPYGLNFMGKAWDKNVPNREAWKEVLRVLKPGGHLLAFAGTKTQHRMACAIEDAGFEIRDQVMWLYGSGFPKSHDVSKAIDKAVGAKRDVIGREKGSHSSKTNSLGEFKPEYNKTAPATSAARQWQGWGTALKPAFEPIVVARKPLIGTVAKNVLTHGTGALNIDGCRVGTEPVTINTWDDGAKPFGGGAKHDYTGRTVQGRWPANVIHDGSEEVVRLFPQSKSGTETQPRDKGGIWTASTGSPAGPQYGDSGSAARFFYCAKASKKDRDEGVAGSYEFRDGSLDGRDAPLRKNHHPTVKPTDLMQYLCRLVTPPGGIVLDPFMGSGSTGKAAVLEGFSFIGYEFNFEYIEIAKARINAVQQT